MTTHKNTKQHKTTYNDITALLLFSIGLLFSSNTFALFTHQIGETYGGGKVFYVYDGGLHGLIAALADQSPGTGIYWDNGVFKVTGTTGDGLGAGAMNTTLITATQMDDTPSGNFAAKLCANYSVKAADGVTYGDWYLPSKAELNLLFKQKAVVGGFANAVYWSSTETSSYHAWSQNFLNGSQPNNGKHHPFRVRAVRAF
jgi:hypothetical protein